MSTSVVERVAYTINLAPYQSVMINSQGTAVITPTGQSTWDSLVDNEPIGPFKVAATVVFTPITGGFYTLSVVESGLVPKVVTDASGNPIGLDVGSGVVPLNGTSCEAFGAKPSNTAAQNVTAIQNALNVGGLVTLLTPGTYYVAGTQSDSGSRILTDYAMCSIGSDTRFVIGEGVIIKSMPGAGYGGSTLARSFLCNKNINSNRAALASVVVTDAGTANKRYVKLTFATSTPHGLTVGGYAFINGDTNANGYNGYYKVQAVPDSTHFEIFIYYYGFNYQTSFGGTPYVWAADDNIVIDIRGQLDGSDNENIVNELAFCAMLFNKVGTLTWENINLSGWQVIGQVYNYDKFISNRSKVDTCAVPFFIGAGKSALVRNHEQYGGEESLYIYTNDYIYPGSNILDQDGTISIYGNVGDVRCENLTAVGTEYATIRIEVSGDVIGGNLYSINSVTLDGATLTKQTNKETGQVIAIENQLPYDQNIPATFTNGLADIGYNPALQPPAYHFTPLVAGQQVAFRTTGGLPTGFVAGTFYYVIATGLTNTNFQVSATLNGAAITAGSAGTGTQTVSPVGGLGKLNHLIVRDVHMEATKWSLIGLSIDNCSYNKYIMQDIIVEGCTTDLINGATGSGILMSAGLTKGFVLNSIVVKDCTFNIDCTAAAGATSTVFNLTGANYSIANLTFEKVNFVPNGVNYAMFGLVTNAAVTNFIDCNLFDGLDGSALIATQLSASANLITNFVRCKALTGAGGHSLNLAYMAVNGTVNMTSCMNDYYGPLIAIGVAATYNITANDCVSTNMDTGGIVKISSAAATTLNLTLGGCSTPSGVLLGFAAAKSHVINLRSKGGNTFSSSAVSEVTGSTITLIGNCSDISTSLDTTVGSISKTASKGAFVTTRTAPGTLVAGNVCVCDGTHWLQVSSVALLY